jgi:tetraacyldisaccharide 4'-kinase
MYKILPGLAPAAFFPGLVFEALARLRNSAYDAGRLRQHKLAGPVISVGNITMGGTGKTPMAICIAGMLLKLGCTPAILSRGYKRSSPEMQILAPGVEMECPASALGDEPALIRRRVPEAWIGISKNRLEAGRALEQRKKGLAFILDDGFQHRKLFRNLDVVLIDRGQPLESNRVFPRGSLREPISALRRCDLILINGRQEDARMEMEINKLGLKASILACEQKIAALIPFDGWRKSCDCTATVSIQSVYPVAALGNPERFLQDLNRMGIEARGKKLFPDHHRLSRRDWMQCCAEARENAVDAIITTEKDAIKISEPPDFPLIVAVQSTHLQDSEAMENILRNCIGSGCE